MVACVALSAAQPFASVVAPMTTSVLTVSHIEQLKQQLHTAVKNDDEALADSTVSDVANMCIPRELLELTRFGGDFNNFRRQIGEKWPAISKRCKAIIKVWQEAIQGNTSSCTSSANGTPNVNRKLTPANRRVSSTGITGTQQTLSPSGGYAPKSAISPAAPGLLHKSQTVGAELSRRADDARSNGKRKAEDDLAGQHGSGAGLKRTKTVAAQLASPAPTGAQSVAAARRVAQSTTDLIAQMTSNLPETLNVDKNLRKHEEQVKREQADEQLAQSIAATFVPQQSVYVRGKRKYERKQQPKASPPKSNNVMYEALKTEDNPLVIRLKTVPRADSPALKPSTPRAQTKLTESQSTGNLAALRPASPVHPTPIREPSPPPPPPAPKPPRIDWEAMLPSIEDLRIRANQYKPTKPIKDLKHCHMIRVRGRPVLALPIVSDVDRRPDFILHNYPNKLRYYAEENFLYGSKRPKE